jgi:hypothetical protein
MKVKRCISLPCPFGFISLIFCIETAKRPSFNAVSIAGIALSETWRAARLKEVREDKLAESIYREVRGRMPVLEELEAMRESSGSDSEDEAKKSVIDVSISFCAYLLIVMDLITVYGNSAVI